VLFCVVTQGTLSLEAKPAVWCVANERLLVAVNTHVLRQPLRVGEALIAPICCAEVRRRFLVRVHMRVGSEVGCGRVSLAAPGRKAGMGILAGGMHARVSRQMSAFAETFAAIGHKTDKWPLASVSAPMDCQFPSSLESFTAVFHKATVRSLFLVFSS
jgi:hypothetical protein